MSDLKQLYSEIIRRHNETPFHFEKVEQAPCVLKAYNPVCGDRFDVYLTNENNTISKIHFHGFGCAISKASTSVLTKSLEGKSLQEARVLCDNFLNFIEGDKRPDAGVLVDDYNAFSAVHDFPERRECATLAWNEMKKFLKGQMKQP